MFNIERVKINPRAQTNSVELVGLIRSICGFVERLVEDDKMHVCNAATTTSIPVKKDSQMGCAKKITDAAKVSSPELAS